MATNPGGSWSAARTACSSVFDPGSSGMPSALPAIIACSVR